MSNHRLVRKDHLILIAAASMLIIASSLIGIDGYFGTPKIAYSQSDQDQMNSNTTKSVNIQDIPLEKVRVGDIDIACTRCLAKVTPFYFSMALLMVWMPGTRPF